MSCKFLFLCAQDHFRKVCTPNYVNVFRDRGGVLGVVEFDTPEDLARAIRKLDDTEFRNPFERAYIRVVDDSDDKRNHGKRSRSRSRSRRAPALLNWSLLQDVQWCAEAVSDATCGFSLS